MRTTLQFALMSALLWVTSCASQKPMPDVTIQNASTNHLDWVEVRWGENVMTAGVLPPGVGKTELHKGLPARITTNFAIIRFINEDDPRLRWESGSNEEVRARRATSEMFVPVDVSPLLRLGPRQDKVTFRILSLTNADVLVQTRQRQ